MFLSTLVLALTRLAAAVLQTDAHNLQRRALKWAKIRASREFQDWGQPLRFPQKDRRNLQWKSRSNLLKH